MTDRDRFIEILAREIAFTAHTRDEDGNPVSEKFLREFYGQDWLALFRPAAMTAVAKAESKGFMIIGPDDGR